MTPAMRHSSRIDPRRAMVRVGISIAFGLAAYVVAQPHLPGAPAIFVGWDIASFVLLVLSWAVIVPSRARETRERAGSEDPGRTLVYVIILVASAVSLLGATVLVRDARGLPPDLARVVAALCLATVALAWTTTHTAFTFRYAHLYYREDSEGIGGVDFPGKHPPTYFDFAYFAFTIGMCFQVSDVCVSSTQIRRAVLLHAVMSFAYNSIILAFVLNLVFSLAA
jgi:uncharacterized membrane protein